ncbi:unnamed protein product [Amoebophrya sp. A120]|nr:unnamed protein product [Amoebophrya sp. A120]|eukprot:GSA120T00018570001.1
MIALRVRPSKLLTATGALLGKAIFGSSIWAVSSSLGRSVVGAKSPSKRGRPARTLLAGGRAAPQQQLAGAEVADVVPEKQATSTKIERATERDDGEYLQSRTAVASSGRSSRNDTGTTTAWCDTCPTGTSARTFEMSSPADEGRNCGATTLRSQHTPDDTTAHTQTSSSQIVQESEVRQAGSSSGPATVANYSGQDGARRIISFRRIDHDGSTSFYVSDNNESVQSDCYLQPGEEQIDSFLPGGKYFEYFTDKNRVNRLPGWTPVRWLDAWKQEASFVPIVLYYDFTITETPSCSRAPRTQEEQALQADVSATGAANTSAPVVGGPNNTLGGDGERFVLVCPDGGPQVDEEVFTSCAGGEFVDLTAKYHGAANITNDPGKIGSKKKLSPTCSSTSSYALSSTDTEGQLKMEDVTAQLEALDITGETHQRLSRVVQPLTAQEKAIAFLKEKTLETGYRYQSSEDLVLETMKRRGCDILMAEHMLFHEFPFHDVVQSYRLMKKLVSVAPRLLQYATADVTAAHPDLVTLAEGRLRTPTTGTGRRVRNILRPAGRQMLMQAPAGTPSGLKSVHRSIEPVAPCVANALADERARVIPAREHVEAEAVATLLHPDERVDWDNFPSHGDDTPPHGNAAPFLNFPLSQLSSQRVRFAASGTGCGGLEES